MKECWSGFWGSPNTYRRHVLWACSRCCIADGAARRRTGAAYKRIYCIHSLYRATSILLLSLILKLDIIFYYIESIVYYMFSVSNMFSKWEAGVIGYAYTMFNYFLISCEVIANCRLSSDRAVKWLNSLFTVSELCFFRYHVCTIKVLINKRVCANVTHSASTGNSFQPCSTHWFKIQNGTARVAPLYI